MRVIVQKASDAICEVEHKVVGTADYGYMLLVGFTHSDTDFEIDKLVRKILGLRIFEDDAGKLNKNIFDVKGSILAISQFTLYADARKGNRPSFIDAMCFEQAEILFDKFVEKLRQSNIEVQTGIFGSDMNIKFTNVGPTTIWLDSKDL